MTTRITGISQILDGVDAVLCDQYGVLHDGQVVFDGALECLTRIVARGVPIIAVTNSGKSAAANAARLARFGFDATLISGVLSSGEVARHRLSAALTAGEMPIKAKVYAVQTDTEADLLAGLDVEMVDWTKAPDLVLLAGVDPVGTSRESYGARLAPLAKRGVPVWCANPDLVKYTPQGPMFSAGLVAQDYAQAGGDVTYIGKPSAVFFRQALTMVGAVPPARVLMIGDSPVHDIAGAAAVGVQTVLIESGVQAGEQTRDATATYAMERLVW
ncbi:TIGR01459 family HAD-type hydrolase [Actibacterium sp. 188UL27-1]|uniref:TIGR01459 family HAD-type hydrolase n=1 Tax=Actibacterium sp. 188UL27-1 TaxID=2786961 RepID=UPI00195A429D|nr:TIGR01459 family HAD-type hydrolase [Actibacterium sp. 188UL27-1]MBM7069397.1 TIGR01459 family HAD-type hydrolase [Actibacterium sp. 188UL27-1]